MPRIEPARAQDQSPIRIYLWRVVQLAVLCATIELIYLSRITQLGEAPNKSAETRQSQLVALALRRLAGLV